MQAELDIDFEALVIQYQKIFNTQLIDTFGSPDEIDKHYSMFFKDSIFSVSKDEYDKFVETNLLYIKLNCFEQYQRKVAEIVSNFCFVNPRLIDYNEKKIVLDSIVSSLYQQLKSAISYYKKYDIIIAFYTLASYISELSQRIYSLYDFKDTTIEKHQLKENEDKLLFTVKQYYSESAPKISSIIGTDKRIMELLLNAVLFENIPFGSRDISNMDFTNIYIIAYSLSNILFMKNAILSNLSEDNWIEFNHSSFTISEDIMRKMDQIVKNSYLIDGQKVDVYSERLNKIYNRVKRKLKFAPADLEEYLHSRSKLIKDNNLSICVDRKVFEEDVKQITGIPAEGAKNMVDYMLLKDVLKEEVLDTIFSDNKRVFRAPIVQIEGFLLISFPLMVEASKIFRYRILKREITNDNKTNDLIKKLFDEFDLSRISLLCESMGIKFKQNWELAKELKDIEFIKGISKEIDFAFVINKILYLVQLKDKKMRIDTKGVLNEKRDALKDIQKYKCTCEFIMMNSAAVQQLLKEEFVSLSPYFLFTRYNPIIDLDISKGDINVMVVEDFMKEFTDIINPLK